MALQSSFSFPPSSGLGIPQQPQSNSDLDTTGLLTSHFWGRSATDKNIVFIDTAVKDYQQLAAGVISGDKIVLLDPKQNEIEQISRFLATEKGVESIHIVSHGSVGSLQLGNTQLNINNLNSYNQDLGDWRNALAPGGDILLYGCDVASGKTGQDFVQQLAGVTRANVEASVDLTGSKALGGNWQLEYSTGVKSNAALAFTPQEMESYTGVLASVLKSFATVVGGTKFGPEGVAIDIQGNTYTADYSGSRIVEFDSNGKYLKQITTAVSETKFQPVGVAIDTSGNIYAADYFGQHIVEFDSNGNYLKQITTAVSGTNFQPRGFGIDTSGNIYVGDFLGKRIVEFSPKDATTTIGNSNNSTAVFNQEITFTATVTSSTSSTSPSGNVTSSTGSTSPSGNVTFTDENNNLLGTVPLDVKGVATLKYSHLAVGLHTITENYSGDSNFIASTGTFSETVKAVSFNEENYLRMQVDAGKSLVSLLFDEKYYLAHNSDVANAVAKGQFKNGLEHFLKYGEQEGRDPSVMFSNSLYLAENPDVAKAVAKGQIESGFVHFLNYGLEEHRDLRMLQFDEGAYLAANPDVQASVANGGLISGFQHYLEYGQKEGRNPGGSYFNEAYYLAQNPDVAAAVKTGSFQSGFDHFIRFGLFEGRNPSANFSNAEYLSSNSDASAAVASGSVYSGYEYALRVGQFSMDGAISELFNEDYYLQNNPDVAAAEAKGLIDSGFDHFILYGQKEGRSPSPNYSETFYLAHNPDVAAAVKSGGFQSGFEHYLKFGRTEGRQATA